MLALDFCERSNPIEMNPLASFGSIGCVQSCVLSSLNWNDTTVRVYSSVCTQFFRRWRCLCHFPSSIPAVRNDLQIFTAAPQNMPSTAKAGVFTSGLKVAHFALNLCDYLCHVTNERLNHVCLDGTNSLNYVFETMRSSQDTFGSMWAYF